MIRVDVNPQDAVPELLGMIISAPTGVSYGNQCGGMACLYREMEGYLTVVGRAERFVEFFARFDGWPPTALDRWVASDLRLLEEIVGENVYYFEADGDRDFRVDVSLNAEDSIGPTEGWIPVLAGRRSAVIVFANSD